LQTHFLVHNAAGITILIGDGKYRSPDALKFTCSINFI